MELVKKLVQVDQGRCQASIQLTLDDDFNVSDRKPDVRQIVAEQGEIHTNEITPGGDKVQLDGALQFQVFYISDQEDGRMQGMNGEIPFREWVNLPETCQGQILVKWILEDLNVAVINSRKISVRAVVTAQVRGEEGAMEEIVSELEEDDTGASAGKIQTRRRTLPLMQQKIAKKDTFRVKDEYILPSSKPDMEELVYKEVSLRGVEVRLLDDRFSLKGELHFMIFYYGGDSDKLQYLELELPFSGTPECIGCNQDMIPDVEVSIQKKDIQIKPDEDGEERILDVEVILELSVRIYGEERLELLEDFYATDCNLEPVCKELELQELQEHYSNKLRLNSRIPIPEAAPAVLQLCGTSGEVKVDECSREEGGIRVEGVIELPILYITSEDSAPVYMVRGMLPFDEIVPAENMPEQAFFEVKPVVDQIALSLLDSREIDAKATMNLETFLFCRNREKVITGYAESEIPEGELQDMPGIIGYYVQDGDSWWTVGRKYRVSVDKLKKMNEAINSELEPGMRLLIQKENGQK